MHKLAIAVIILITSVAGRLVSADECGSACQEAAVNKYFHQVSKIYKKGSAVTDIEELFKIMDDSVNYEHLNYEARFSRDEWKEAFLSNYKRGAYQNDSNQEIKIESHIQGKGYIAVSYSYGIIKEDGSWAPKGDQKLMAVFALVDGKIASVKEYW